MTPRAWLCFVASTFVLWPTPLRADGATEPVGLAVPDIQAEGEIEPRQVTPLSAFIGSEAASQPGIRVITGAQIRAMLGFEAERQLLDCEDDTACLTEIGGALGVPYVLSSEASRFGDNWLLTFSLLNVEISRSVATLTLRARTESELLDQIPEGVARVLASIVPEAAGPVAPPPRKPRARLEPKTVVGWSAVASGVAMLGGGGWLYGDGRRELGAFHDAWAREEPVISYSEAIRIQRRSDAGLALLAGGAALVAGGLLFPHLDLPLAGGGGGLAPPAVRLTGELRVDGGVIVLEVVRW